MKHFLRLSFIASVLFVLLGLFKQTNEYPDSGVLAPDGLEQTIDQSGILSSHQEVPSLVSISSDSPAPGFAINELRKLQEELRSIQSKCQLVHFEDIFKEIQYDLLQRTGRYLYDSPGNKILS
ncbi:MAG: hypothetical protein ABFS28_13670 [Bacteroidota bacterium]